MVRQKTKLGYNYYEDLIVFSGRCEVAFNPEKLQEWLLAMIETDVQVRYIPEENKFVFTVPGFCKPGDIIAMISNLEEEVLDAVRQENLLDMVAK